MIKKHLKKSILAFANAVRLPEMKAKRLNPHQVTILNLHQVSPESRISYPSLSPDTFRDLCVWIKKHFEITSFEALGEEIQKKQEQPKIILSFDDGYYDFLEYAVPIMDELRIGCNLNVIGQSVEFQTPPFTVQLAAVLSSLSDNDLKGIEVPGFNAKYQTTSKEIWSIQLSNYLKSMSIQERGNVIEGSSRFFKESLSGCHNAIKMMSAEELRSIPKSVEIGNHSYSHESMKYQPPGFFEDDFQKATRVLEDLDINAKIYAFPNGSYEREQVDYLKENGIEHVLLVNESISDIHNTVHDRITFYASSAAEAKVRASGLLSR